MIKYVHKYLDRHYTIVNEEIHNKYGDGSSEIQYPYPLFRELDSIFYLEDSKVVVERWLYLKGIKLVAYWDKQAWGDAYGSSNIAIGYMSTASGNYSTAIGSYSLSTDVNYDDAGNLIGVTHTYTP